jgi:aromatic-L-amino-acid/L-tryptophan decarboxylase
LLFTRRGGRMEATTDIDLSPDTFRELGYRVVDILVNHLATLAQRDMPVRTPVPDSVRKHLLTQPPLSEASDLDALLNAFVDVVLPYPMGNGSPRFFAWVNSPSAPFGVLAELLAAGMNPSVAGGDHAATYVEHAVLNWLKVWLSYPTESGGILTSGGSEANLIALAVMRSVKAEGHMRAEGFQRETHPMVLYTSNQGHSCLQKVVQLLGFGSNALRQIPVDAEYRLDVAHLKTQIAADRAAGFRPVCVAASAGTVNTGAIDPLEALADLCDEEGLWLHVDGAYGGLGILAEQTGGIEGLYRGLEHADSLAVDPHKWMYIPVECGCVLVRAASAMRNTFSLVPPYLRDQAALPWFSEFGIQQTRGFKALKLWLVMQHLGERGYREFISRDVALARALQARLRGRGDFELVAAGPLSITCFRYAPPGVRDLDALNRELLERIQGEGHVYLTSTELEGQLVLRACVVNFRTTEADLDRLLEAVAEAGQHVLSYGGVP